MPNDEKNEGEGNKTAAREYDKKASEFAKSGKVDPAAQEAKEALETDADALQAAEDEGRRHIAEEDPAVYEKGRGRKDDALE